MGLFRSASGMVAVELTSADPNRSLQQISEAGVLLFDICEVNGLTLRFRIRRMDYRRVKAIAGKMGDTFELRRRIGLYWTVRNFRTRKVLLFGLALLAALAVVLPQRIYFVQVEGNGKVPSQLILEKAAECGIGFGATRRDVRSEKMKNALLSAIPELQWAGINTKGCVAVISVREKTALEDKSAAPVVSRIVASRDAVILSYTVEQGNAVCKVGQAVKAGELLVSGYTDCGISIKATRSVGEIYGQTNRELSAVLPDAYTERTGKRSEEKKYGLIIGKKRINFYKDSGILGATCDKMYTEYVLTLPGGFRLPVSVLVEKRVYRETQATGAAMQDMTAVAADTAHTYLNAQMVGGKITQSTYAERCEENVLVLDGVYRCVEMIGRIRGEEIIQYHGENN